MREHDIDLVFTDLKMPGIDGMKVLAEVRYRYNDVPVIMIAGHATLDFAVAEMKQAPSTI